MKVDVLKVAKFFAAVKLVDMYRRELESFRRI